MAVIREITSESKAAIPRIFIIVLVTRIAHTFTEFVLVCTVTPLSIRHTI